MQPIAPLGISYGNATTPLNRLIMENPSILSNSLDWIFDSPLKAYADAQTFELLTAYRDVLDKEYEWLSQKLEEDTGNKPGTNEAL